MSTSSEKLVYLQNGVFKRKEMSNGLQYYSDGSFSTLAIPEANGNYLLTKGDGNTLSWSQQGDSLTSLNNSFFKDSNNQAISIGAQGTIPYFVNNSTFAPLNLPTEGKYVLIMGKSGEPSFATFDDYLITTALGITSTSGRCAILNWNSTSGKHVDLTLPNNSGVYILKATDDSNTSSIVYNFNSLNASTLFHDSLGVQSTNMCLIAYKDNTAYGVTVPAMGVSSGYFVFKKETNNEVPTTNILDSNVIYKDIFGCTNEEQCIVINDKTGVSKLTIPSNPGTYLLNVTSSGVSFSTKFSSSFNYIWTGSGHTVVTETLGSNDSNVSEEVTLSSNSKYMVTIDLELKCGNYEQAFVGFTSTPTLTITFNQSNVIKASLDNPMPTTHLSGTTLFTPPKSGPLTISITRTGDTTISHLYSHFQVSIVEM